MSIPNPESSRDTEPLSERHYLRMAARIAAMFAIALLILAALLYLMRRPVAAWLMEYYLRGHGIESAVTIERLDFYHAAAKVRLGAAEAPDLAIQRIAIGFDWQGLSPHIVSLDLDKPILRSRYNGHTLSFGVLQNLIGPLPETANPNASPGALIATLFPGKNSRFTAQNAQLILATQSGTLIMTGSANFSDGRIHSLSIAVKPAKLKGQTFTADIRRAIFFANANDRLQGTISGTFAFKNQQRPITLNGVRAEIAVSHLRWKTDQTNNIQIAADANIKFDANHVEIGNIAVNALHAQLDTQGQFNTNNAYNITGSITASGTMPAQDAKAQAARIPVLGGDPTSLRALAKALRHFSLRMDGIHALHSAGQTYVTLASPAIITGDGATLQLTAQQGPLLHVTADVVRGSGQLSLEGTQLPKVTVTAPSYTWQTTPKGSVLQGQAKIQTRFSLADIHDASVLANGAFAWRNDRFTFALDRCARVTLKAVAQKKLRIVQDMTLELCGQPDHVLLATAPGQWNMQMAWQSLSARLPVANVKLISPSGTIVLSQANGAMTGTIAIKQARLKDLTPTERFAPLLLAGNLTIKDDALSGQFHLTGAHAKARGALVLSGSTKTGRGRVDIRVPKLAFAPSGLQPADLSPMLAPLTRARGTARFIGHIAWARHGISSQGLLTIQNLSFLGPMGEAHATNSAIQFASLFPLRTAPDQVISIAKVDWATPITNVTLSFRLLPGLLEFRNVNADLAKGQISLGQLRLPLSSNAHTDGKLIIRKIDIGSLLSTSNLADKIKLSAQVSGTVPFRYGPEGFQFVEGHIAAAGPSKLSITPDFWSAKQNADPGAVRGFAYQALEHLAIDKLEGTVNSLPNGRLGLLLHIQGYNDPPTSQPAKVGLIALLQGKAFDKSIPLPKGTKVNLTLDTSLNFAELLAAYRKAWAESLTVKVGQP